MPVCCGGCCYIDCIPDCLDRGCCGKCCDVLCCKTGESTNFTKNDPNKCCCGYCNKCCNCCDSDNCRKSCCIWTCCSGNWIVDCSAWCCGEYKGNLAFAEQEYNVANKGSPAVEEMTR